MAGTDAPADADRTVFGRVLDVIGAFADSPEGGLTASAVAAATGLPMSTAHRLCRTLAEERVLERAPDGRYRVGIRLWELGLLAPRSQGLRQRALPFLEDLHEVTRQHVQLLVLDGPEVVVVERLSTRDAVVLAGRPGGRLPVHATSGGVVLLALADEATVAAVLARPMERFTPATITSEPMLRATLSLARRQGWIVLQDHLTPGSVSVAAPILGPRRQAVAAVSVIVDGGDGDRLVPAVLTTAKAIGRALAT
ncbi:IclR family transcriptional regulator [Amnibacterium kyonggiense]|uniref:IclR family transcriptional regulator n=1 Tax=Amnibacterium kyonggiense TaxID=595671 RepID=A0A4R7FCG5_9MICO|nr:IclR family transcriptional regulator [Amnibacterium kyonggiense]TDS74451.1 IclR family transcriptional regulator [Amnibacterium kyonggiense]